MDRPGSGTAALLAVGGMLEAVASVVVGEITTVRAAAAPGDHAEAAGRRASACRRDRRGGALGELARGAARVAILDWDVHHGNGTEAIFRDDASVLTVSLHQDGLYPADTGAVDAPGEAIVNVPLPPGTRRRGL